jgi:hypothetical protein
MIYLNNYYKNKYKIIGKQVLFQIIMKNQI